MPLERVTHAITIVTVLRWTRGRDSVSDIKLQLGR